MRIVYIHQYFNTPTGRGSTRSYEMAKRLATRGHDVHIVSTDRAHARYRGWRTERVAGYTVHRTYVPYDNALGVAARLRAFAQFSWKAALKARRLKGDAIFATSTPLTIALPARIASAGRSVPMIFEVRDLWPEVPIAMGALPRTTERRAAYFLQRFAYKNANHIVALSPDMRDGIVDAGYPASQVTVIPNSSDLDLFAADATAGQAFREENNWLQERPLALYCGTLGRVNNVSYIIRLAEQARKAGKEYRFLIVGDGSERESIIEEARAVGVLNENLFIFESLPKVELAPIYSAATVALSTVAPIPALWANSANKVFDAFASGTPVAINHEGWQSELLRDSGAGVVMNSTDTPDALTTLGTLMDDPAQAQNAGLAAHQLAKRTFSRDIHGAQLAAVLERFDRD